MMVSLFREPLSLSSFLLKTSWSWPTLSIFSLLLLLLLLLVEFSEVKASKPTTTTTTNTTTILQQHQQQQQQPRRNLIIGGSVARPNDWPYFVHFENPACGGSLIAPDIVLTAGHCQLTTPQSYGRIHVGQYDYNLDDDGSQQFRAVRHVRHPLYTNQLCCGVDSLENRFAGVSYDFMVLKLNGQSTKQVVSLATPSSDDDGMDLLRPGDELHVIGFGDIDQATGFQIPSRLHEVTVNYLTNQQCADQSIYPLDLLPPESLCATDFEQDGCQGDSGGCLVKKGFVDSDDVQVGVVSWGYGCAEQPGVYARVSHGYDWIRQQVCTMSDNPPSSFKCSDDSNKVIVENFQDTTQSPTPRPPTSRPTPQPISRAPSPYPTASPTTSSPTKRPTSQPTTAVLTPSPTTRQPTTNPTATIEETDIPIMTTEGDSSNDNNVFLPPPLSSNESSGEESDENDVGEGEDVDGRATLPDRMSCGMVDDPFVCCSARDGTSGEPCMPSMYNSTFTTGTKCESLSWIQSNENDNLESYRSGYCNVLKSRRKTLKLGRRSSSSSSPHSSTTQPCSRILNRMACCMARDINGDFCVPSKHRLEPFSNGKRCESSRYVVRNYFSDNEQQQQQGGDFAAFATCHIQDHFGGVLSDLVV